MQLRVLRLGLSQDRNVRVRVLPQCEEILICRLGFGRVALQYVGATEAKMGKRTDGPVQDEAAMIEDLLELGGGLATVQVWRGLQLLTPSPDNLPSRCDGLLRLTRWFKSRCRGFSNALVA
jgi:hypothetical protein